MTLLYGAMTTVDNTTLYTYLVWGLGDSWKHNTIYFVVGSTITCVEADEGDLLRSVDGAATAADNFPQEIYLLTTGCRGSVTGTHLDAFCWFDFYTAE